MGEGVGGAWDLWKEKKLEMGWRERLRLSRLIWNCHYCVKLCKVGDVYRCMMKTPIKMKAAERRSHSNTDWILFWSLGQYGISV